MNNLGQRVLTGAGFGLVMIFSVLVSSYTFIGIFFVIAGLGLFEFYRLNKNELVSPQIVPGIIISQILFLILGCALQNDEGMQWMLLAIPFSALIFIIEMYRKLSQPFLNIAITLTGMIYVTLPMMLVVFIGLGLDAGGA